MAKRTPVVKFVEYSCIRIGDAVQLTIPMRLNSITNGSYGNRFAHTAAKNRQQTIVRQFLRTVADMPSLPLDVELTRIGVQEMDEGDNLRAAFKYVRDAIAAHIGVDDGNKPMKTFRGPDHAVVAIKWNVLQECRGMYGIRIVIRPRRAAE